MAHIEGYHELNVYRSAFETAMCIFDATKSFPVEERYSLVDQIRLSSRSVCTNIAEAWRKRRYPAHFVSKLSDAESEAEETRVWLEFAYKCSYLEESFVKDLHTKYDKILSQLVVMIDKPEKWMINR